MHTATAEPAQAARRRSVLESIAVVLATLIVVGVLSATFGRPARAGGTMEPTIPQGSRLWLTRVSSLERGQVVVLQPHPGWNGAAPDHPNAVERALRWLRLGQAPAEARVVVRIIGLPGDEVRCCGVDGSVVVNGQNVPAVVPGERFRVVVPEGRYFVATDAPSSANSACYLSRLGVDAMVTRDQLMARVARAGGLWSRRDLAASAAVYAGPPGRPAAPEPIIEAGKDPSC